MKGFIRFFILTSMVFVFAACASRPLEEDGSLDDLEESSPAVAEDSISDSNSSDELSDVTSEESETVAAQESTETEQATEDQDLAIEDDFAQEQEKPQKEVIAEKELEPEMLPEQASEPTQSEPVKSEAIKSESIETVPAVVANVANIRDLKFKANELGGTVIITGDRPLIYKTRINSEQRQFVIEVENANLPENLKRTLNTKDIKGSVGAIDAYQNPGSSTARFVIQLREGVLEPTVQLEGNNLLVVANRSSGEGSVLNASASDESVNAESPESKILPSQNLAEFLAGNTNFYGKKISIETSNIDVKDALNLITEESGVNMVIAEEVKGPLSLKLRQVPWDQALVVIMKAKKLGYTRQGNVLRISPMQELKAEEEEATRMAQVREKVEPLRVRMFPVNYAKAEDLEKKVKDFLGERGKVVGDPRTNSLVITDTESNLERVAKLIASIDTQPPQVLIESKIVEAKESFTRNIGVSWSATGSPIKLGSTSRGPINMNPAVSVTNGGNSGNFNFNLSVGTLDFFGTLSSALALSETEEQVKIISSPRIMTLTNEKAEITQTTEVPIKNVTSNGTSTTESFTFKPLTLKLDVTPQVTADGSVIMKVLVNRQFKGADLSAVGAGAFSVNSREANTRVLVKNGQTAVIGGIYQSDATDGETGVPWLRELPFFGPLFRAKNTTKDKSELLVFLTPRVIVPADATVAPPVLEM